MCCRSLASVNVCRRLFEVRCDDKKKFDQKSFQTSLGENEIKKKLKVMELETGWPVFAKYYFIDNSLSLHAKTVLNRTPNISSSV